MSELPPADVVVVGCGVVGLSTARSLAREGLSVVCVGPDHNEPGTASSAAGAMLGALGEVTTDADGPADRAELAARVDALRRYPAFLAALTEDTGLQVEGGDGTLVIANLVNEADRDNLAAIDAAADEFGLVRESVAPTSIPALRPSRGYEAVAATYLPEEGWVDTDSLLTVLATDLARRPAVRHIRAEARELLGGSGSVTGVRLDTGDTITAGAVVLAAGVGVQALLDTVDLAPGLPKLLPGKGVSVRVTADVPLSHVIRTPNREFACGTHAVPRADGSIYLGATNRISNTPGSTFSITPGELHALLHSAMHEINTGFRTAAFMSATFGLRPLTTDHHPLVGATSLPGLFVATGTYRNGILLAPLIAGIVTAEITGSDGPANPFAPDAEIRRSGPDKQTVALERGMRDLVSFLVEPGGHLPYNRHRELRAFLQALGRGAMDPANSVELKRLRDLLDTHPMPEMVPQAFYEIVAAEEHGQP